MKRSVKTDKHSLYEMKIIFKIEPDSVITSSYVPSTSNSYINNLNKELETYIEEKYGHFLKLDKSDGRYGYSEGSDSFYCTFYLEIEGERIVIEDYTHNNRVDTRYRTSHHGANMQDFEELLNIGYNRSRAKQQIEYDKSLNDCKHKIDRKVNDVLVRYNLFECEDILT